MIKIYSGTLLLCMIFEVDAMCFPRLLRKPISICTPGGLFFGPSRRARVADGYGIDGPRIQIRKPYVSFLRLRELGMCVRKKIEIK